ncbi:hypothetical protein F442_05264 [Phytophthora nicotianae P10297]|uniref:SET domain-containing protein n=1 Tax=Phytophthora nicotianae P10297 TaxID=1317064 RepID=W2ZSC3_PHYNI|nr:hypothetical protein F442_05264 [Phytophthora nicotianae P10297]
MIYHTKTVKAVKFNKLRNSPEIKKELEILHTKRSTYSDPIVAWPAEIERITTCKRNGVKFPDIGSYDPCKCFGDCFWDTCTNVASASFCMPQYCKLGAICSNAPRTLSSLKLFDTGRVGLGVYTTTDLDVGDAVKTNTGYTLLYNTRSVNNNYVYVDALRCGSITRFISHSCEPNATFLEQQTRSRVRVLVKMIKNVQAGAQITVHYGNERWFKCACDLCWKEPSRTGESSGDE